MNAHEREDYEDAVRRIDANDYRNYCLTCGERLDANPTKDHARCR